MSERLAAYLLGTLEPAEREAVERELSADPELAALAEQMRRALGCDEDDGRTEPADPPAEGARSPRHEFAAPRGLAADTCAWIEAVDRLTPCRGSQGGRGGAGPGPEDPSPTLASAETELFSRGELAPSGASRWRLLDLAVAATLAVGLAIVFLPALAQSRARSEVAQCRDHLRQVGTGLIRFSRLHGDQIPGFDPASNEPRLQLAGLYGPILVESEIIDDERLFLCPGSPLAYDPRFHVPTREQLIRATPQRFVWLRHYVSGSYAMTLGTIRDGRYEVPRWRGRSTFALLADAPNLMVGRRSTHHPGGQNVLYEDGHVAFVSSSDTLADAFDDPFVNRMGQVAPAISADDAVVAPGWFGPEDWSLLIQPTAERYWPSPARCFQVIDMRDLSPYAGRLD